MWLTYSQTLFVNQNKILQKQQEKAEKNMDIIQDAMALDQDLEYNQQAMMDLIGQQTSKMQEGLDEEFEALGEDEMMQELNKFDVKDTTKQKDTAQKTPATKEKNYDDLMKDLLA